MPLQKTDLTPGSGAEISKDQTALVHYTGWLYDAAAPENKGKQFDSSVGGEPFEFQLGAGHVIPGWDQGVVGMKVGGKRRLVIPAELAYGAKGAGAGLIPPGATLVFDVELVEIR
jgi:FKBP-type peptidyl-prolyl cis-trans isomerase FkpA